MSLANLILEFINSTAALLDYFWGRFFILNEIPRTVLIAFDISFGNSAGGYAGPKQTCNTITY